MSLPAVSKRLRLAFFGSGAFGLPTLQALSERHEIVLVVSQPDRPAGRGGKLTPTPIAAWAAERLPSVPMLKPERVGEPGGGVVEEVRRLAGPDAHPKVDAWVVIAFGQKLPAELLEGVRAMNLHASLLPRWRGAAPINAAVLAGDAQTGNSVITLAERMDAGLVLGQSVRPIEPLQTAGELHDLLAEDGPELVLRVLDEQVSRRGSALAQDESRATRAGKMSKADDWLDFTQPARAVRQRVHGLTPWPGITVRLNGETLKLLRVQDVPGKPEQTGAAAAKPGELVDAAEGRVSCGNGTALKLLEVQPAGKKPMKWADYARGRTIQEGTRIVPNEKNKP